MFFDDWCKGEGFYRTLPLNYRANFSFGQFFLTHAYYPHKNLEIWRPVPGQNQLSSTIAKTFQIETGCADAFRRRLPLGAPKLETNEEFIVIRAKKRPVVMLLPKSEALDQLNKGYRAKVQRHLCLVAQVFSLYDPQSGDAKFDPDLIKRIRRLEYPQFMFLPKHSGMLDVDSVLRLDELQSVFTGNLEPYQYALNEEPARILQDQFRLLITGKTGREYSQLLTWMADEAD